MGLLAAVLVFAAQPPPAAAGERPALQEPADDFIDLLRFQLGDRNLYSFATHSLEGAKVEGIAVVPYSPNEIVDFYRREFQRLGLEHHEVAAIPARPIGFFLGKISGEEKIATATAFGDGSVTLVHLYSERSDVRFQRDHRSLLDAHPELARLGDEVSVDREYLHAGAPSGIVVLRSGRGPSEALAAARRVLLSAGWREQANRGLPQGFPTAFTKDDLTASVFTTAEDSGTSVMVQLRGAWERPNRR